MEKVLCKPMVAYRWKAYTPKVCLFGVTTNIELRSLKPTKKFQVPENHFIHPFNVEIFAEFNGKFIYEIRAKMTAISPVA